MKLTVFCLFAALNAGAQNTTQHLPPTDAEKIADALRAGPNFITDHATILDWPAKKGGESQVLRKGSSEWTCLPGPPPGATHDEPGCFDKVFFQWATDGLAGRPQHIDRLGVAYMYTGAWVSELDRRDGERTISRMPTYYGRHSASGGTAGFQPRWAERHIRDEFARRQSYRSIVLGHTFKLITDEGMMSPDVAKAARFRPITRTGFERN